MMLSSPFLAALLLSWSLQGTNARLGGATAATTPHRKLQQAPEGQAILGEFFVKFDQATVSEEDMDQKILEITDGLYDDDGNKLEVKVKLMHKFKISFRGFYICETTTEHLEALLESDYVESVEEVMEIERTSSTPYWNLDRIDETSYLHKDQSYDYLYDGEGVDLFILDGGIYGFPGYANVDVNDNPGGNLHPDFATRVTGGCIDYTGEDAPGWCVTPDDIGHGVHVANIAAGTNYGVSKKTRIHDCKVLKSTGSGSVGGIMSAVDDIMTMVQQGLLGDKVVINMSLGTRAPATGGDPTYRALDYMIDDAVDMGIVVVVAAGNDSSNACWSSPARAVKAVTVGGFNTVDAISSFSNTGDCVDIYAPGNAILSGNEYGGEQAQAGTSMSAPHVAGAIANYMSANVADPVGRLLEDAIVMPALGEDVKFLYTADINTDAPSSSPSQDPSSAPSATPTAEPSISTAPSDVPSQQPTPAPSISAAPSSLPSISPTNSPTETCLGFQESCTISAQCCSGKCLGGLRRQGSCTAPPQPSDAPSFMPSNQPSDAPTQSPAPSHVPSILPSEQPSELPSMAPSQMPSILPSETPSDVPSESPSKSPSESPSDVPSLFPTDSPTEEGPSCLTTGVTCTASLDCCNGGCLVTRRGSGRCN